MIGSLILGLFFYFLEKHYIPSRKRQLNKRLIRIFKAKSISDSISYIRLQNFDICAVVEFKLQMSQYNNIEKIDFHIPRKQIDELSKKPPGKLTESQIKGLPTYTLLQCNGYRLKWMKSKLDKRLIGRRMTYSSYDQIDQQQLIDIIKINSLN